MHNPDEFTCGLLCHSKAGLPEEERAMHDPFKLSCGPLRHSEAAMEEETAMRYHNMQYQQLRHRLTRPLRESSANIIDYNLCYSHEAVPVVR